MSDEYEDTLDPDDWDAFRALTHRAVDDMIDHLQSVRDRPVWQAMPDEVCDALTGPAPRRGQGEERAYADFREFVLPYPMGNTHPRFWAWYMGNGTPFGAVADFLAASMNPNLGGGHHAANHVEAQVIEWCKEIVGWPTESSGLLVSGGSMANLVGLTVARNHMAPGDVRKHGVQSLDQPMLVYASDEVHSCVHKTVEVLGLGTCALREVPVNAAYEMDMPRLEQMVAEDRALGGMPFCVIGNAGTINTGSVDDLDALADFCGREKLWFHVDGAIGAVLAMAPKHRKLVAGIERADSVTIDLHKWMHVPFEAACALVRNKQAHRDTFVLTQEYLEKTERGLASGPFWFSEYGLQLSRGFRALKVWMSIKEHGLDKYGRLIDRNIAQAKRLRDLVAAQSELELLAPTVINIVCFRFNPGQVANERLNAINQELLIRLHESGIAVTSYTTLGGRYCLRVAIANYRTRDEDLAILMEATLRTGRELMREGFAA
jgi:aromatic-L-amino-acid decarboxylase